MSIPFCRMTPVEKLEARMHRVLARRHAREGRRLLVSNLLIIIALLSIADRTLRSQKRKVFASSNANRTITNSNLRRFRSLRGLPSMLTESRRRLMRRHDMQGAGAKRTLSAWSVVYHFLFLTAVGPGWCATLATSSDGFCQLKISSIGGDGRLEPPMCFFTLNVSEHLCSVLFVTTVITLLLLCLQHNSC